MSSKRDEHPTYTTLHNNHLTTFFHDNLVSRHLNGKPFWILPRQELLGWQWHRLDHMQIICTSLQTDNHASTLLFSTPPTVLYGVWHTLALPLLNSLWAAIVTVEWCCFQDCVWHLHDAESDILDGRQQCFNASLDSTHSPWSLVWNLCPSDVRWRLLWLQKTSMTAFLSFFRCIGSCLAM